MKFLKVTGLLTVLTILVYVGIIKEVEGFNNIAIYLLYGFGFVLALGLFLTDDKADDKKEKQEHSFITKLFFRIWFGLLAGTLLYYEYFLMGTLYFTPFLLMLKGKAKDEI